jgi:hypothetical protein
MHVGQRPFQRSGIELAQEYDRVEVGWHNHEGVYPQGLAVVAEVQAVGENSTGLFRDEDWEPIHD